MPDDQLAYKGTTEQFMEMIKEIQRDLENGDVEWTIVITKEHVQITKVNGDSRI